MVSPMIHIAVQVKHVVQSIKVTVIMMINAKESLSAVLTSVLQIFQRTPTAVHYQIGKVRKLTSANDYCRLIANVWIFYTNNASKVWSNLKGNCIYTVLHIFRQVLFWAGNQGNHKNFDPSLLTNKL